MRKQAASLPHDVVYARISRSRIHGVGVRAIRKIKKGTYVFKGDPTEMIWVDEKKTRKLPKEMRSLYHDFAVKRGNQLGCPTNFNSLTPAWYLNHSRRPNLAADAKYDFYALRDIKVGEELTADYSQYSEDSK